MSKNGLIGMVVLVVLILSGVIIWQHGRLSSAAQAATADKAHSAELQKKVESLEQEVKTLKETADYYFQQGVDQQSAGNLQEAKTAFEAVVAKFPASALVASDRQRLAAVNEAIAKTEADRLAEAQRQKEEQARLAVEEGEPIDYALFYAKAQSVGLPIGKRFRFRAQIGHNLLLSEACGDPHCTGKMLGGNDAAFDDESQYERFLQGSDSQNRTVVASMGSDGRIKIHRIE